MSACLSMRSAHKEALAEAALRRTSTHLFTGQLSLADWAELSYLASRYASPGIRMTLLRVPEQLFSGTLLTLNRIVGCTAVCVLTGPDTKEGPVHGGYCSSAFVLHATHLGYATCYVTGGYQKKLLDFAPCQGEKVYCLIAVGRSDAPAEGSHRKELRKLCVEDPAPWAPAFLQAAVLVQHAPSEGNRQPVLMGVHGNDFWIDSSDRTRLDLGIAICHADLAFRENHRWVLSNERAEPMARAVFG